MGAYSDKLRRRDFNVPRRGFYKTEGERKQLRPVGTEKVQSAEKRAGTARVSSVNSGMAAAENAAVLAVDHHYGAKLKNSRSEDIVLMESSAGTPGDKLSFSDGTKEGISGYAGQAESAGN